MNRYWMTRHAVVVACALGFWGFTFSSSAAALDAISDDSDVPLDFSSDESRQETDSLEGSIESQSPTSRPRSAMAKRRLGSATHFTVSASQTSSYDGDGYSVEFDIYSGASFSLRLNDYFSWGVGVGRGGYDINLDTRTLYGSFSSGEYSLLDEGISISQKSLGTSLKWNVLGGVFSTPYVSVGRSRVDSEYEAFSIVSLYSYGSLSSTPIETSSTYQSLDENRSYATNWFVGYEHAVNQFLSVSGGFGHSLRDGKTLGRSFGAAVDIWLSPSIAFGLGASMSHEDDTRTLGLNVAWVL